MEVTLHKREHSLLVATDVGTQGLVAIRAQTLDDAVDHCGAEYIVLLEDSTLTLQTVGRSLTTVGQLSEVLELILILLLVDVHVNIGALGNLQRILHLEAVAARNGQACYQLIDVGRAIW